jgi:hypothetical protein
MFCIIFYSTSEAQFLNYINQSPLRHHALRNILNLMDNAAIHYLPA